MSRKAVEEAPCPICGRPADPRLHPFCSTRCADVDLGHWLTGSYAIPVPSDEDDEEAEAPPRLPGHDGRA